MEQPETRNIIGYGFFQYPATTNEPTIRFRRYGFSAAAAAAAATEANAGFRATKDRAGQVSEFDLMAGPLLPIEAFLLCHARMFRDTPFDIAMVAS
jgi:hypothetical protein